MFVAIDRKIEYNSKYTNIKNFVSILYAFSPILKIYASPVPGLSISEFSIVFLFILLILTNPTRLFQFPSIIKPLIYFLIYGIILTLYVIFFESWSISSTMIYEVCGKILFFIMFIVGFQFWSTEKFVKYLIKLADIAVIFLFIQIFLSIFGIHISGIIPFLPLSNNVETAQFISNQLGGERFSSIFSEPAHLSEFIILPLIIISFGNKPNYLRCIFYTSTILISHSATGFTVLGVILLCFIFNWLQSFRNPKYKILFSIISLLLVIILIPSFSVLFGDRLDRFAEISGDGDGLFSGYLRVMRGYILYNDFTIPEKLFGQGFGCIIGYISTHKTDYLSLTDLIPEYVNSIQYILISTGIVGFCLISNFLYKIFRRCNNEYKIVIICLIMMMASTAIFFSITAIIYLLPALHSLREIRGNDSSKDNTII